MATLKGSNLSTTVKYDMFVKTKKNWSSKYQTFSARSFEFMLESLGVVYSSMNSRA